MVLKFVFVSVPVIEVGKCKKKKNRICRLDIWTQVLGSNENKICFPF